MTTLVAGSVSRRIFNRFDSRFLAIKLLVH